MKFLEEWDVRLSTADYILLSRNLFLSRTLPRCFHYSASSVCSLPSQHWALARQRSSIKNFRKNTVKIDLLPPCPPLSAFGHSARPPSVGTSFMVEPLCVAGFWNHSNQLINVNLIPSFVILIRNKRRGKAFTN